MIEPPLQIPDVHQTKISSALLPLSPSRLFLPLSLSPSLVVPRRTLPLLRAPPSLPHAAPAPRPPPDASRRRREAAPPRLRRRPPTESPSDTVWCGRQRSRSAAPLPRGGEAAAAACLGAADDAAEAGGHHGGGGGRGSAQGGGGAEVRVLEVFVSPSVLHEARRII